MNIVTREQWGAESPRRIETTTPDRLFLHHTVGYAGGGAAYMRSMQDYHLGKGWDDIAYNFVIDPVTLEIFEGQGWGREPNAQAGYNEGTWAVAIMGDFSDQIPSGDLLLRIAGLVTYGQQIGELPLVPLEGHRDAPGSEGNECPGTHLYDSLDEINTLIGDPMLTPKQEAFVKDLYERMEELYPSDDPDDVPTAAGISTYLIPDVRKGLVTRDELPKLTDSRDSYARELARTALEKLQAIKRSI